MNKIAKAAQDLNLTLCQSTADDTKLAEKLNGIAESAIDTLIEVMQDKTNSSALRLQAAQTLLKARQEANDSHFFD